MRVVEIEGGISRDHLVTVGGAAAYDQPGGPGVYAALGAVRGATVADRRSGRRTSVRLRAVLPAVDGDIAALLTTAGVDLSACRDGVIPTLWILNSPQGRRIVSTSPGAGHELDESEAVAHPGDGQPADREPASGEPGHGSDRADVLAEPMVDVLLRSAPMTGLDPARRPAIVLVDPDQRAIARDGWKYLERLAETTDVFLPSRVQLSQLGGDARAAAEELRRRTERAVVARLDAEGSLVLPAEGGAWRIQAVGVEVVDTTGAGDSHAGSLAASLTDARDARALVSATVVATAVVGRTLRGLGPAALADGPDIDETELRAVRVQEEE